MQRGVPKSSTLVFISVFLISWLCSSLVTADASGELKSALSLFKRGKYDEAEKMLREIAARDDEVGRDGRYWLAKLLEEVGKYEEAEKLLRDMVAEDTSGERTGSRASGEDAGDESRALRERNALAELMVLRGRFREAEAIIEETIEECGQNLRTMMLKGVLLHETGRRDEAEECFGWCIDFYQDNQVEESAELLSTVAVAGRFYADRTADNEMLRSAAQEFFPAAIKKDKFHFEAYLELSHLFLDRYNHIDAKYYCDEALKLNEYHPEVRAALAECLLAEGNIPEAEKEVRRALTKNPNLPEAHFLSALVALVKNDQEGAATEAGKALEANGNHLGALAILAAVATARGLDEEFKAKCEQAESVNDECGEFYYFIGEMCSRNMLFAEATRFYRRAVELDPKFGRGYCALGLNLIRNGEEGEGRAILEKAWERDRLNNVWLTNMLRLVDDFDEEFILHETEHFVVRMNVEESPLLARYVDGLLERAYESFTGKYGFEPRGKTMVYLFPRHEDFSVMTVGLVGIGALGVCFGKMVAADSPSVRNLEQFRGNFNWGQVLWHELAHVITVQMSGYRTPRWLTEGISVYEERCGRKEWGREFDAPLFNAYHSGGLLPLKSLDSGFANPAMILLCYYHASKIVEYAVEKHGVEKVCELLRAYAEGLTSEDAFGRVYGISVEEFDDGFRGWLGELMARVKVEPWVGPHEFETAVKQAEEHPEDAAANAQLGWAYYCRGDSVKAEASAQRALALDMRNGLAYLTLGHVYYEKGRKEQALEHYRNAEIVGMDDFYLHYNAGRILLEMEDDEAAIEEMEKARECFPGFVEKGGNPYSILIELYRKAGMPDEAMGVLEDYVALCESDFEAMTELAGHYEGEGEKEKALAVLESANYVRPINIGLHASRGRLLKELGRLDEAIEEYRVAAVLAQRANKDGRGDRMVCDLYCEVAELYLGKGMREEAREYLDEALFVDPENERAKRLLERVGE